MRVAPDRYGIADNSRLAKHVVAAGRSVRDAGSIPAASTIFRVVVSRSGARLEVIVEKALFTQE